MGKAGLGALLERLGPIEATLAGDHDAFGDVAQHRVGRAAERPPRAVARGRLGLAPDDLAPQQEAQLVLEDAHDVGRQAAVGLAAEVGHVDREPPAGLEDAHALGEHLVQQPQVVGVGLGDLRVVLVDLVVLAHEVGGRGDDEGDAVVGQVEVAGVAEAERLVDLEGRRDGLVARDERRREALVERGRVVTLAPADPEVRRRRRAPAGLIHVAHRRTTSSESSESTARQAVAHRRSASRRAQAASLAT
jgi:putative ubiquitin-RnfH superfamily antitoxin RatB of RatAB toxin-antitoxin module